MWGMKSWGPRHGGLRAAGRGHGLSLGFCAVSVLILPMWRRGNPGLGPPSRPPCCIKPPAAERKPGPGSLAGALGPEKAE